MIENFSADKTYQCYRIWIGMSDTNLKIFLQNIHFLFRNGKEYFEKFMSYANIGYVIYKCSEMKGISLYVQMFLVNVLSVMQDIEKVKHIYFSFFGNA